MTCALTVLSASITFSSKKIKKCIGRHIIALTHVAQKTRYGGKEREKIQRQMGCCLIKVACALNFYRPNRVNIFESFGWDKFIPQYASTVDHAMKPTMVGCYMAYKVMNLV